MDQYFRRNTIGISSVEFLWGLGMPVVVESTFLQLFLRNLGASNFLIGLIPTVFSGGVAVFSLFAGTLTGHVERKRPVVITVHVAAALPMLTFGILLSLTGFTSSILLVFFCCYALFSTGIGFVFPVWQNYLVKIFTQNRSISALSVMWISQSVAKIISSYLVLRIVERYSFSAAGSSMIFTAIGLIFLGGSFLFLITREHSDPSSKSGPGRRSGLFHGFRSVLRNRNFLLFLGTDLEFFALIGIISFYANYATEHCDISAALASGLFVAFNYLGGITVNVLLGWFQMLSLKGKYWITKTLAALAVPLICIFCRPWAFFLASYLFGASRSTRMLVYTPAVKRLSGQEDATHYFAVAPLFTLPLSVGLPLINGAVLDRLAFMGAWSYRLVFLAMALLSVMSLIILSQIDTTALQPESQASVSQRGS
ncbi:MAG: MFS transporter [Spirochaetaceae bacterium]|nr:MAG: MFS transporter [Spirochaetaceae bacterium]